LIKNGCTLNLFPAKGLNLPYQQSIYPSFFYSLKKNRYDVVQVQDDTNLMTHLTAMFASGLGSKTVLWQGMYLRYTGWKGFVQKSFEAIIGNRIYNNIDLVLAKTTTAEQYLKKRGIKQTSLLPVGIDLESLGNNNTMDKQTENFSSHHPVLLYVGQVEERRNLPFLIRCVYQLKTSLPDVGLIVIGKGSQLSFLKKMANELELNGNIIFCGQKQQKELPAIYKAADVFLLPTSYEIFGMVVLEALAYGTPVIATPQAGPLDILKKPYLGECIVLSEDAWVSGIKRFLPKKQKDSASRIEHIKSKHVWPVIAKNYANMLEALID
jgi:glycosyltransferase involved in cell wall biosynthesis